MPIYGFTCKQGHTTEQLSRLGQTESTCTAPGCTEPATREEVPPGTSHQLKGAGWARDNYGLKGD